jgi:hypothetical protein
MASASVPLCFDHLRRLAGYLPQLAEQLRASVVRLPRADVRIAATATLLGVTASAALTLTQPPQLRTTATKPAVDAPADATAPLAGPVKIIGAAPRSENCAEQVWPYIEQRCLTRAADKPKASPVASDAAPGDGSARERATSGVAPAEFSALPMPMAAQPAKPRVATAYLPAPRPRFGTFGTMESDRLVIPRGATPIPPAAWDRHSVWQDAEDVWAERRIETPMLGEPRRRSGRRGNRSRYGGTRPLFGFPF